MAIAFGLGYSISETTYDRRPLVKLTRCKNLNCHSVEPELALQIRSGLFKPSCLSGVCNRFSGSAAVVF